MYRQSHKRSRWSTVGALAIFLFVATLVPAPVHDPQQKTPYELDKLVHFLLHACFSASLARPLEDGKRHRNVTVTAIAISTVYGVLLEHLQERVPGRRYESGDVLAGAFGSIGGIIARRWLAVTFAIEKNGDNQSG